MPNRIREKGVQPLVGAREKRTHKARENHVTGDKRWQSRCDKRRMYQVESAGKILIRARKEKKKAKRRESAGKSRTPNRGS